MRTSCLDSSQRTGLLRYADDYANASNLVIDTDYSYDLIGRLTQIDHTDGTATIHKFDFTYDAASRIDTFDSSVDGLFDYSYDDTNQLTLVEDATPSTLESYSYDDNGNRTMTGYATGDYNRLTDDGTYDYEYDNEGNRTRRVHSTSGATRVYEWDHRNRLTAVIDYADETDADNDQDRLQTVEHQYDAFNQWIAKTLDADGGGAGAAVDEFYVHESGQIAFRLDDSGAVENRYVWDPTAVDKLLADEAVGDELRWSLTDHLGTVRDLVDNAGNVDKHIEYDSFGDITTETATSIDLLFAYTGRPLDGDTDLQNNLNRWYDAPNGTWVSEDPIGFGGGDANLSRYVGNATLSRADPTGLQFVDGQANQSYVAIYEWFNSWIDKPKPQRPFRPASANGAFVDGSTNSYMWLVHLAQLKPNWDQGYGPLHHTTHDVTVGLTTNCDTSAEELEAQIFNDLRAFEHFNSGANTFATVEREELEDGTVYAFFSLIKLHEAHGSFWVIGNDEPVPVQVTADQATSTVSAVTLDEHQLVGIRRWSVSVNEGAWVPRGDCERHFIIEISTESYERARTLANHLAFMNLAEDVQLQVWESYLLNIIASIEGATIIDDSNLGGTAEQQGTAPNPWGPANQGYFPRPRSTR